MYVVKGGDPKYCTASFKEIKNQLLDDETIGKRKYTTKTGFTVEPIAKGKTFKIRNYITLNQ